MHLGIDIDTHQARAAFQHPDGTLATVAFPNRQETMPCMARQTMHGLVVGWPAAQALVGNAETTVVGCTRLMGHAGQMPDHLLKRLPYPVRQIDGQAVCNLLYAEVYASQVYGQIARALVDQARQSLGQAIDGVVLTIPASAQDRFRVQVRAAVEAQGLTVRRLINQPTAALVAADLPATAQQVAVVHCGGGSIDVSLAERNDGNIRILASTGNPELGGDDLAWQVANGLNDHFRQSAHLDVFASDRSRVAALGLRAAAEEVMKRLSLATKTTLVIDHGGGFGRDLMAVIQRGQVEAWLARQLDQVKTLCQQALNRGRLAARRIDAVLLTGEWAYLPALQLAVARAFNRPVAQLHTGNAARLPVYGAALAGADRAGAIWDVTPYPLGINCYYDDVELFSPIIAANTPIPTPALDQTGAFTESYQTRYPDQSRVKLDILQYRGPHNPNPYGPAPIKPDQCEVLGSWHFDGLRPRKGKRADFTVTFAVDADGVLHLYAKETATGHHLQASANRGIG